MLKDLNQFGEQLKKDFFEHFSHKDFKLPESFKTSYSHILESKGMSLGYKKVIFHNYSAEIVTTTDKTISIPNFWFIAANHFSPFIIQLIKYKVIVEKIKIEAGFNNNWPRELKGTDSIGFKQDTYNTTKELNEDEFSFILKFLTNYKWWNGGKTIDRGDYYVSPILKLGNFLAESQSAIAEIAWQIAHMKAHDYNSDLLLQYNSIVPSKKTKQEQKEFDISSFEDVLLQANLFLSRTLPSRFIASLQTKPFVILTGLSGSGKTKLAEAFSLWITDGFSQSCVFKHGDKIEAPKSTYSVIDVDRLGILLNQGGSNTTTFLPFELIKIWVEVILENNFDSKTGAQEIQAKVAEAGIPFASGLNSFHSPLKACALKYIEAEKLQINLEFNNQYSIVSVGADWTNREPILGYPNALESGKYVKPDNGVLDLILNADVDSDKPYFLILDEMNMSHVERYFADFLSAMESTDRTITLHPEGDEWKDCDVPASLILPENLFIIGTVNIDETTYMFSPKVLDRANVIEFRVSDTEMESFFESPENLDLNVLRGAGASMANDFIKTALQVVEPTNDLKDKLMPFFNSLKKAGAEFGYRTAFEMNRFITICNNLSDNTMNADEIIDAAIIQKLLPKVHGSRNKIEPILKDLAKLCLEANEEPFQKDENGDDSFTVKYPLSYEKLERMHHRVISDGFTSFAEA